MRETLQMLPPPHGADLARACERWGGTSAEWIDFSSSVNPYGIASDLLRVLFESAIPRLGLYPDLEYRNLRESLAHRHGIGSESIWPVNGSVDGIHLAVRALGLPRVVAPAPSFREYAHAAEVLGIRFEEPILWGPNASASLARSDEAVLDELPSSHHVYVVGNPNSPTGESIEPEFLAALIERSTRVGGTVIVDEAFLPFLGEDAEERSLVGVAAERPGVVLLRSITKSHALPGLRFGYIVAEPGLIARLRALSAPWAVNAMAEVLAMNLERFDVEVAEGLAKNRNEASRFAERLAKQSGIRIHPSSANFFLCESKEFSAAELRERLAERKLLIRSCADYPGLGDQFFRVAVRRPEENDRLIAALQEVLNR